MRVHELVVGARRCADARRRPISAATARGRTIRDTMAADEDNTNLGAVLEKIRTSRGRAGKTRSSLQNEHKNTAGGTYQQRCLKKFNVSGGEEPGNYSSHKSDFWRRPVGCTGRRRESATAESRWDGRSNLSQHNMQPFATAVFSTNATSEARQLLKWFSACNASLTRCDSEGPKRRCLRRRRSAPFGLRAKKRQSKR